MSQESLLKQLSQLTLVETCNLYQENTSEAQELVGTCLWGEVWPLITEILSPGLAWPMGQGDLWWWPFSDVGRGEVG